MCIPDFNRAGGGGVKWVVHILLECTLVNPKCTFHNLMVCFRDKCMLVLCLYNRYLSGISICPWR